MQTGLYRKKDIKKEWLLIDAKDAVVGRLASQIAKILMGKHKPGYVPYLDCGDNVVVVNADKVAFSGRKAAKKHGKVYYRHTGYVGGIKQCSASQILSGPFPERVLQMAVLRMLKKNARRSTLMKNLKLFKGEEHVHKAQNPRILDLSCNSKNFIKS
ncbi:50S ribosomal protein L13 [Candidatus Sneabacter namystus]|uniref:Large ribosomal subunit protein uL13 n=1 Tax=Candidatus Sneabacter namystus TaxID=2601646 RepID=A0A5C0UI74_9RICK|nr:50S ribosomal protein L13 [Candidatus Sneabacter namystus]QEK39469.1 50S ribosomal protein L13 [Candidatus Sneabacter namystus]